MSTAASPADAKEKCSYYPFDWRCPFDAENDHDLCIFHLPVDQKKPEDFWRNMASYLIALYYPTPPTIGDYLLSDQRWRELWFAREFDPTLVDRYRSHVNEPWRFAGFVFPAMDDAHNFDGFVFRHCDFTDTRFSGAARFSGATFSARAYFPHARFGGDIHFENARLMGEVHFGNAEFSGNVHFENARFNGKANFSGSTSTRQANFWQAVFSGEADFGDARISGEANFGGATFGGEAHLGGATFGSEADFRRATFSGGADFWGATFNAVARFWRATFSGPACLSRTTVDDLLDFTYATLRDRLLFEGTVFGEKAKVLLWGLDLANGMSDSSKENEHEKGKLVEPAGQVVFRDVTAGMNHVSLLHTDILTDRLWVRFANVKWETDPKEFIFDAKFAFCREASEWEKATELAAYWLERLPELFHTERSIPWEETDEQKQTREAQQMADCEPLVRQNVERIAREIRQSYEKYGNYSDAGDYYIAEMAYRERTTPWSKPFLKVGLCLYGLLSRYGESAGRALFSVLTGLLLFSYAFVIAGFKFMGTTVNRDLRFVWSERWATLGDIWLAVRMALANLMPGNLRGDVLGLELTSPATKTWAVFQVIVTYILLTLLLLAIRRRFRR